MDQFCLSYGTVRSWQQLNCPFLQVPIVDDEMRRAAGDIPEGIQM